MEAEKYEEDTTQLTKTGLNPTNIPYYYTKKQETLIETRVYTIQREIKSTDNYFLDIDNKTLVDQQGQTLFNQQEDINISQFGSLTEKLYSHRNIQALNQSGFAWLSLFKSKDWRIVSLAWTFLLSIVVVGVLVFNKEFTIDLRLLLGCWLLILGCLSYLLNQSEGDKKIKALGHNRQSVGPSYINADIFANTLLDILENNTMRGVEDKTKRLGTLFYTPAKPILGQWLKELQSQKPGNNIDDQELVTGLTNKYKTVFDKVQERSSGVYKRNAKGLSFLLGLLLQYSLM